MHQVIKKLIQAMQKGSSGEFTFHDETKAKFSSVVSISGDDNEIVYLDQDGAKQKTSLGLLINLSSD